MAAGSPIQTDRRFRFGPFELSERDGELRRNGIRIKLQEQPLRVLLELVGNAGLVVTREELQQKLWPADTFVDFDLGLNTAVRKLRQALGDDAEGPRYIETLAKRGYRFIAPVSSAAPVPQPIDGSPASPSETAPVPPSAPDRRRRWLIPTVGLAVIALAAGVGWYTRAPRTPRINSIAVMPFANGGGDANTEYLSDGITESLINNLAHVPQLKVKSRNTVFHYKGKDIDAKKVGSDLGVAATVNGRVVPRGDSIEVSAELTDVRDNTVMWGHHYSGKSADIILLQQQIASDIAQELRSKLSTSEKQQVANQGTHNPEAYELYLKGRYAWNTRGKYADIEKAISYFNQAIAEDPGYALAYSGLADAYLVLDTYGGTSGKSKPKTIAALRKALELDPSLGHPHAVLGAIEMGNWDFAKGEAEFKKAIKLDPNDAAARHWYSANIGRIGGREQEAVAEANRAHQLDPLSPIITENLGIAYIYARQYDEAIAICTKSANENPIIARGHNCLFAAYWAKRMYPQVIQELKAHSQSSGNPNDSELASGMEEGFRLGAWKGALTKGIEILQAQRKSGYATAYDIATFYADLGDTEQAFRWLNTAYQERNDGLVNLKTDFLLDPLRSDPRFDELVRKVGLP